MHLFLYKAARHTKPASFYQQRRLVQGTYRNDFDLELIKSGIKGRYTILPHGSNAFQARLKDFDLEEEMYGHLIEVPEARNAIWFKLNYDNIGKPGTTYVGSWKSLDVEVLTHFDAPYQELSREKKHVENQLQQVRYHSGTLASFLSGRVQFSYVMDEAKALGKTYLETLSKAEETYRKDLLEIISDMEAIRNKIRAYMKSQEM